MPYVVGHRGAAGVTPENTLEGFQYAIDLGVDMVECDVHLTWDHRLVVMHDATVDRTTNGTGAIRRMRLEAVRSLDAGAGRRVPTLSEVLDCVRDRVHLLCELKGEDSADPSAELVRVHGMVDQVTFTCFDLQRLERVRRLGEEYLLGANLTGLEEDTLARLRDLRVCRAGVLYRNLCLRHVDALHEAGLDVRAWNPDTWREQRAMIQLGVDGVSSNRPDILIQHLRQSPEA